MSHYPDSLDNNVLMCPCANVKDIPQEVREPSDENVTVENGFEAFSGDSGSDEEQDTLAAQGYVPLNQNEDESTEPSGTEVETFVITNEPHDDCDEPVIVEPEISTKETSATSSLAVTSTSEPQMPEDEIDLIKSIMMKIKLPTSAIPEWAKKIPEDQWIAPFVSSFQNKTTGEVEKPPEDKSS